MGLMISSGRKRSPALPQEELGVIDPLVDEVGCDWLRAVGEVHVVQRLNEQGGVVVQRCYDHLQTHGPQLAGLHATHQPLQHHLHEQRDALQTENQLLSVTPAGNSEEEEEPDHHDGF